MSERYPITPVLRAAIDRIRRQYRDMFGHDMLLTDEEIVDIAQEFVTDPSDTTRTGNLFKAGDDAKRALARIGAAAHLKR